MSGGGTGRDGSGAVTIRPCVARILEDIADRSATVGYYVSSAARGRGVATAALAALVPVALHDVGLVRVVADIDPGNVASRRVVERSGFRAAGRVVIGDVTFDRFVVGSELPGS